MRKIILTLFSLAMLFGLSLTAFAVSEPEILREPQNLTWPENSVAGYTYKAKKGKNQLKFGSVFLNASTIEKG